MQYQNDSVFSNDYDTLDNKQPSIFYLFLIITFNVFFLIICGGLIIIAKKFLKSIPPGRKFVGVKSKLIDTINQI